MQETKLTIRLPRKLVKNARWYARQQNTTLPRLIEEYLHRIIAEMDGLENAPIVRRLSGMISQDVSIGDYWAAQEAKHKVLKR